MTLEKGGFVCDFVDRSGSGVSEGAPKLHLVPQLMIIVWTTMMIETWAIS